MESGAAHPASRLGIVAGHRLRHSSHAYGLVLALILISLAFQLAAPDDGWARFVTILLQGGTLLAAFRVSGAHRAFQRVAALAVVVATLGSVGVLIGSGELGDEAARLVAVLLVIAAPVAIAAGVYRDTREGGVTVRTMFGVLCIYLLVGMLFSFTYGLVQALGSEPFFTGDVDGTISDFLYFSFTTITTTGYGDFTPAQDVGRSLAITEQLIGQIYLVTVVALIVANLGRGRGREAER